MELILCKNYDEMSKRAAELIAEQINKKPNSVLGLATGATPIGTYSRLIEMYKNNEVDFKNITTFNLDEYYPISRDNPQSYYSFMRENLFNHININPDNTHIPNGEASNPTEECTNYENMVETRGIDLQILGIGRNGHIGFNEPSDALNSGTHLTSLTQDTIEANAHFFEDKSKVPTHALTMGMATIFKAKKIILLANGRSKLNAVKAMFSDEITTDTPATMLKMHPDVTVICDYDAYADTRIGIDIGGMSAKVGVIENNEIIERVNVSITKDMTADNITDELISVCKELILHYRAGSIGIGVPGIIKDGKISMTNLPFKDYALEEILSTALKIPVKMDNDANCAALGEQIAGAGRGADNLILITLGTGVGAGIIIDGKIYSGRGAAGEVGHMRIDKDGKSCACGKKGCWEKYASVSALIEKTKEAVKERPQGILAECAKDGIDGRTVFTAMDKGSKTAQKVYDSYIEYLALGLENLINIFDPELILIAGGISKENERLLNPLKEKLKLFDRIEIATLRNDAGIIGAAGQQSANIYR